MTDVLTDIWDRILSHLKRNHSEFWRGWFQDLGPVNLENGVLRITVPDHSRQQYLKQMCNSSIVAAAQQETGYLVSVEYVLSNEPELIVPLRPLPKKISNTMGESLFFSPDYTFENFVVGPSNRLSHATCVAVSEALGKAYNPLFVHGSVGLGKTHLMQATCQTALKRDANLNIKYMSCETFVNDFMRAVEEGNLYDFRYTYRHSDMLVIDDIQFLSERERSQEEFFHTFNTLYQAGKQIILSADCPPSEIPHLEDRLVSRFSQGLVTRIDKPCYETRMAIVRKKALMRGIDLPEDVISFIARKVENNTRELEGALTKVYGMAMLDSGDITLELARQALGEEPRTPLYQVTVSQIIDAVTGQFNVRLSDLQGKRRNRSIAFPRQMCMFLARDLTNHSLEEIGGHFGGRDHTTVMHACRTIDKLRQNDDKTKMILENLVATLTRR